MLRTMLKSKIHGATVTTDSARHADGSVLVDSALMEAADLLAGERVTIVSVATGRRVEAHAAPARPGSGVVGIPTGTGIRPGEQVTVLSYGLLDDQAAASHWPTTVPVGQHNSIRTDPPGPPPATNPPPAVTAGEPADAQPAETADAARLDALLQSAERR